MPQSTASFRLDEILSAARIVPSVALHSAEESRALMRLLQTADYPALEILNRSPYTWEALRLFRQEAPELHVGVGTLLNEADMMQAHEAGAVFGVSPGFSPELWDLAERLGMPYLPGVCSPSEVQQLVARRAKIVKFFPAAALGFDYLQQLAGPFAGLRFAVAGGLNADNWHDFTQLPQLACISGSWMLPKNLLFDPDHSGLISILKTLRMRF